MNTVSPARRRLLACAARLCAAGLVPAALWREALAERGGAGPATAGLPPAARVRAGTWLVLLGTRGGPSIDPSQSQTASAVVVDGRPYLIDCGYGTLRQLVASHLGYRDVSTVFLTHLHDDHTADLASLLSFQWTGGKTGETNVYGPYGTASLVEAALAFFHANVAIRSVDEGRTVNPERQFHGHDLAATTTPLRVFADDRITVTAIENAHYPPRSTARMPYRSLAYRVDTRSRSIVFSGDTAYSPNVVRLARNADVFVCEVIDRTVLEQMQRRAKAAAAAGNPNNIYRHVAETHSSPADVARMASEANVKTVVLNHQVRGPSPPDGVGYPISTLIDGVRKGFTGEVIVGDDLMVL